MRFQYVATSAGLFQVAWQRQLASFQAEKSVTHGYRARRARNCSTSWSGVGRTLVWPASRECSMVSSGATPAAWALAIHWSSSARCQSLVSASHETARRA